MNLAFYEKPESIDRKKVISEMAETIKQVVQETELHYPIWSVHYASDLASYIGKCCAEYGTELVNQAFCKLFSDYRDNIVFMQQLYDNCVNLNLEVVKNLIVYGTAQGSLPVRMAAWGLLFKWVDEEIRLEKIFKKRYIPNEPLKEWFIKCYLKHGRYDSDHNLLQDITSKKEEYLDGSTNKT